MELKKKILGALTNSSGAVSVALAIMIIPLSIAAGGAAEFAIAYYAKQNLQSALDAAVLAAARELQLGNVVSAESVGRDYFESNTSLKNYSLDISIESDAVHGTATVERSTALLKLANIESLPISVNSEATFSGKGMELVMVLDVSGSMTGSILTLRRAATKLLDVICGDAGTRPNTWVGLAPFSGRVNVISYGENWMVSPPNMEDGPTASVGIKCKTADRDPNFPRLCTDLRTGLNQENDAPPSVEKFTEFGSAQALPAAAAPANGKKKKAKKAESAGGKDPVVCPIPKTVGLTSSRAAVQNAVNSLCAGHGTSMPIPVHPVTYSGDIRPLIPEYPAT